MFKRLQVLELNQPATLKDAPEVTIASGTRVVVIKNLDNGQTHVRVANNAENHGQHLITDATNLITRRKGRPKGRVLSPAAAATTV